MIDVQLTYKLLLFALLCCPTLARGQDQIVPKAPIGRGMKDISPIASKVTIQKEVSESFVKRIMDEAFSHLGALYRSGAKGPHAFDCSGFTGYVFKQFGHIIGASSRDQYAKNARIKRSEMRRGDLVFFTGSRAGHTVGHVGIVVDVDRETDTFTFIHASTQYGVIVSRSDEDYYARRYVGVCRVY